MRRLTILAAFSILSLGIVHCVGDDPADTGPSSNNTGDGGSGDATTSADATPGDDSGSSKDGSPTTDSGVDSGIIDSCIGFDDCPTDIDKPDLQLWLRGNIGVTCTAGHVASWTDQSGKGNNATAGTTVEGDAGVPPQCGVATIGGQNVITFSTPAEQDAGNNTEFIDSTLDVDLDFLADDTQYTLFVVHERAEDLGYSLLAQDFSFTKGHGHGLACTHSGGLGDFENALELGYSDFGSGMFVFDYTQGCSGGTGNADTFVAGTATLDIVIFSSTNGHTLISNNHQQYMGDLSYDDLHGVSLSSHGGAIGRGSNRYVDSRFAGNIAEVIGFSAALTSVQWHDVQGYLKRQWGLTF